MKLTNCILVSLCYRCIAQRLFHDVDDAEPPKTLRTTQKPAPSPFFNNYTVLNLVRELLARDLDITRNEAPPFLRSPIKEGGVLEGTANGVIYKRQIKHPMDLLTIKSKADHGRYTSYQELYDDVLLMASNCKKFNSGSTQEARFYYNKAVDFYHFTKSLFQKYGITPMDHVKFGDWNFLDIFSPAASYCN